MHIRRLCPSLAVFFASLAAAGAPALATEPAWLGAADCRIAPLEPAPTSEVKWTGGCVDGYASGKGVLTWTNAAFGMAMLDATLVRGAASGEAVLKFGKAIYEGTTRNGLPEGQGYLQVEDWGWYEGAFVKGAPHGKGTHLTVNRSRYTGDWIQGVRHGQGEATFTTGGSYTGSWKNDVFDGQGTIVYAGAGHKYEGLFQDGRVAGLPAAQVEKGLYRTTGGMRWSPANYEGTTSALPMNARWDELTPGQKNVVRMGYPALEAGDEPPFPAKGQGPLFDTVQRMNYTFGLVKGELLVHVLVGKDGKPLSVTAYGAPSATFVRALSTQLMLERFKPALCRGEPCDMVYPLHYSFSVADAT
ncbi:MORN repeat-containing protein [Massilia suwonensis]|uniref:MORN repeat-containing protein n=1 Tax=Massilia suwonensis TaxID=648895 RepID=A0ABW0MK85_9BURK